MKEESERVNNGIRLKLKKKRRQKDALLESLTFKNESTTPNKTAKEN